MPFKCFVPGCKSGNPSIRKENERAGIRNPHIFRAPKDEQLLEKWRRIVPRNNRDFSSKDRVCELHFEKECIDGEYVHLMPDGSLYQMPKELVTLKKGSIPTIFPNSPAYLSVKKKDRKAPTAHSCSSKNKNRKFDDDLENVIDNPSLLNDNTENVIDIPPQLNDNLENAVSNFSSKDKVCELNFEKECIEREYVNLKPDGSLYQIPKGHVTLKKGSIPTISSNLRTYLCVQRKERKAPTPHACSSENKHKKFDDDLENVIDIPPLLNNNIENVIDIPPQLDDNLENSVCNSSPQFNDFFKFSLEVKNLLTPNSQWSVACTEDFVTFAKWNSKYYSERRVVICKDFSTKIFFMNVEVSLPIEGYTTENIPQLLKKVDDFKICPNADSRTSSGCLGFLDSKRYGRRQVFCSTCTKSRKTEKDAQRKRNQRISGIEKKNIASKLKNVRERNAHLKKQVLDLKSQLARSKYQCSKASIQEVLLEAIAHLPTEQQTAIKSVFLSA